MAVNDFQVWLQKNVVKITMKGVQDTPGMAAGIFQQLGSAGINVELVVQTPGDDKTTTISMAVLKSDDEEVMQTLARLAISINSKEIVSDDDVALITLEKQNLSKESGAAARMFRSLANTGMNIDLISTSLHCITCLVAKEGVDAAYSAVCSEFDVVASS